MKAQLRSEESASLIRGTENGASNEASDQEGASMQLIPGWDFPIDHMNATLERNIRLVVRSAECELAQDGVEYRGHVVGLVKRSPAQSKFRAKRYYYKKLQVLPKLEKNITDLDAQEKRNEEKVIDDFISIMDSLIKEFSARFSQFKELSETFKFIMYPDVISFDKLNLSQFDWLEIEELEMQLIDFQSSSIWIQKFIETRKKFELIEAERLTSNISKNTSNEILETWNSIPDSFNCLKKLAYAILTIFSSTYACESLFSEINNIKDSLRNRLTDDSNSACILLKVTSYNPDISYFSSNLQQQKSH
ncbi:uncharacterized protein TNCV_2017761 [Trichonephila clavipes]|nr:uncharacterized protein TNCV_2017761 [Trichonephila clavipes]